MRALRSPFVEVHELGFYALAVVIVLHLIAVVATELPEGGSITSAPLPAARFSRVLRPMHREGPMRYFGRRTARGADDQRTSRQARSGSHYAARPCIRCGDHSDWTSRRLSRLDLDGSNNPRCHRSCHLDCSRSFGGANGRRRYRPSGNERSPSSLNQSPRRNRGRHNVHGRHISC